MWRAETNRMATYIIYLSKKATKQLNKLHDDVADPIIEAIGALALIPRPYGCKKLKGRDAYRIRVGDYRILYDIFDLELIIDIIAMGHRKDIYK